MGIASVSEKGTIQSVCADAASTVPSIGEKKPLTTKPE